MKKLLSLALVLTMLFTIIAVPSVSAESETTILAKADIESNTGTWSNYTVSGPDAATGNTRVATHSGSSATVEGKTYTVSTSMSNVTVATAATTHPAVATGMDADANILKLTQTGNTSIVRLFTANGALDIKAGDVVTVHFKMLLTDFYDHPGYTTSTEETVSPSPITAPSTFSWKPGYMSDSSGTRKTKDTNIATEKWTDVDLTYEVNASNLATYKAMYGLCVQGIQVGEKYEFYGNFPGTVYIAEAWISRTREVATTATVTVNKIGAGTVTGAGEYSVDDSVEITATPAAGYVFDGWYDVNNALVSEDATYTFTASENTNYLAYFIKEPVNNWSELVNIKFEGDESVIANQNIWGRTELNKNADHAESVSTYEAEASYVEPYDDSFGTGVLKVDVNDADVTSVTGIHQGRLDNIKTTEAMVVEDGIYMASAWIYLAETYDPEYTDKPFEITLSVGGDSYNASTNIVTMTKGKWVCAESVPVTLKGYAGNTLGARFKFDAGTAASPNPNAPTLMYIDNLKIEKVEGELEDVTVSVDATNGVVGGTGSYTMFETVTLTAGANPGYAFAGYYNNGALVSSDPKYTFTATKDVNLVAKFEPRDAAVFSNNIMYHFGDETGENGVHNTWFKNAYKGTTNTTVGAPITWAAAAEKGIVVPNNDPTFGDYVYEQDLRDYTVYQNVAGRFRGWENGKYVNSKTITEPTAASGKYESGKFYKFTWWVYPASVQLANGETSQPETVTLKIQQNDGQDTGVEEYTTTVNVGEWNKIEYTFEANDKSELYAPGIYYEWPGITNAAKNGHTLVNHIFYDNIQVEKVSDSDINLEISEDEKNVTAKATVFDIKSGAATINAIVIIAAYDAEGKLVSVALSNDGSSKEVGIGDSLTATYKKADGIDSYVAFLWDDLTNIRPYTLPKVLGE